MKNKIFTITECYNNKYDAILVTELHDSHGQNYNEYIEFSCDFNRKTFEITEIHYRLLTHIGDSLARWIGNPEQYLSKDAMIEGLKILHKQIKHIRVWIAIGKKHPAYNSMKKESKSILKHFEDDFYFHDAMYLGRYNPEKLWWLLGESHTHISDNPKTEWFNCVLNYAGKHDNHSDKLFFFDGINFVQKEY